MMRTLVTLLGFALAIGVDGALAAEATIGGVPIKLPLPAGFCELSESNPSDQRMLTILGGLLEKSGMKLLTIAADCRQLADWRPSKRPLLHDIVQYYTPIAQMDKLVASPEDAIRRGCAAMRARDNGLVSNSAADLKAKLEGAADGFKSNATSFAGVWAEDENGCYTGRILRGQAENGVEATQVALSSTTVQKNKYITVARTAPYTSADATADLLSKLQSTAAALYAANK
jgi:hypothetical protein